LHPIHQLIFEPWVAQADKGEDGRHISHSLWFLVEVRFREQLMIQWCKDSTFVISPYQVMSLLVRVPYTQTNTAEFPEPLRIITEVVARLHNMEFVNIDS
jgi:hypothetical protein